VERAVQAGQPEESPSLSRLAGAIRAALAALALAAYRRAGIVIALVVALCTAGTWAMSRLALDPDIAQLLPRSYASVRNVEALRDRFGGIGYVVILVEGGTPEARHRFADAVAPRLSELETVSYVDARRPTAFFEERALWFLDRADLETLRDRLRARQNWQIEHAMVDLDDEPPPPVKVDDIEARYRARFEAEMSGNTTSASPYYEDAERGTLAVLVRPTRLASDLTFSKRVVADVERVIGEIDPKGFAPDLRIELTGRYKKRVDLQVLLSRDLAITSTLALALVIAYVAFHFRRIGAVVLVLAPLYGGLALAYGAAAILFGTLNILTAFIGAILVGIGIDNGIHMLGRFEEERRAGATAEAAIATAFGEAGRVSLAAALTSASAFACLAWTDFRAFREFGLLAALGMMLVLATYLVLLPALLSVASRLPWRREKAAPSIGLPGVTRMTRWAPALFWGLVVAGFFAATGAPNARFNADFSRLDDADLPSFRRDKDVNALLGRSQTPMVLLAPTAREAREAASVVRARMRELGPDATINTVATLADLIPEDQADKASTMREIASIISRIPREGLDAETRERADKLRKMASSQPFGPDDLPLSLRRLFATKEGAGPAHIVLLYPSVSMGEASAVRRLAGQLREVRLPSGPVLAGAGEPMVLADILETVERDAPRILVAILVLVLATLYATLGKMRLALLALAPALVTLAVTVGLLPRIGLELDYLNMIILPILLGIGVDDGAHVVARVDAGEPLEEVWRHTGWDITGAILTDVFGFGVLALAAHPGLSGLGKLALVGLGVNMVACVVLLPVALAALPLAGRSRGQGAGVPGAIVTVLGAGKSPGAPGTMGALAALPLAWLLAGRGAAVWAGVIVLGTMVSFVATQRYLARRDPAAGGRHHDPQEIVVDELLGCLIAIAFVPFEFRWVLAAFVLFRLFDIYKPGPIRWVERRLPGAAGILGDDLAAGVMAGALLFAIRWAIV